MGVVSSRLIARKVLTEVRSKGAYVTEALSRVLKQNTYDPVDIGYGTRLAHLSVASFQAVRSILDRYLDDADNLPPVALDSLVVAATELLYLDAPDYTADQGVELMKTSCPKLAGLANAVLRKVARDRSDILHANRSSQFGFPAWLADQLIDDYGEQIASQIMKVSNEEAPLFAYVLSVAPPDWEQQLTQAGAKITPIGENVVRIEGMQHIRQHPLITSRVILVTDLGAQSAVNLAPLGARMLEVGCGRGTKTLIWADRARREGMEAKLIGVDKSAHKIEHAQEDADRLGFDEIGYQVADATDETLLAEETFDVVFVDAPCSGLGTLRRRSDKRLRLKPEDIDELADLSATILRTSAQKVREGGTLLYATCTMSRRENDEVVAGFLASVEGADFQLDPIDESELPDAVSTIRSEHGFVQMQPISGGGDGHFVARLARS